MEAEREQWRDAWLMSFLVVCALLLAARLVYWYLASPERFPVNTVKITASYRHVSRTTLESILSEFSGASFFSLPVRRLYARLSELDWVEQADVERQWPDTLVIRLKERTPLARWNQTILTQDGALVPLSEGAGSLPTLPVLTGPETQRAEVLQVYKKLSKLLSNYGMYATALNLRDNQAWELTLANGFEIRLGKKDLETRLHRFCKAYPAVFGDTPNQMASVDLRYPHGMAVRWKQ